MDSIRVALAKAKGSLRQPIPHHEAESPPRGDQLNSAFPDPGTRPAKANQPWRPPHVTPAAESLRKNRIVSYAMTDPSHVAFNLLRTRLRAITKDRNWSRIAVTSPTSGCGKTTVCVNLALSLSRMPDCRVVALDFDLKKPAVASTLGITAAGSLGNFLEAHLGTAESCFVELSENLVLGLNHSQHRHSSELMHSERVDDLFAFISAALKPDIILIDLPPMRTSDDALAVMPKIDAALLVAAAGTTTALDLDECEQQISKFEKLLGVVLNKSENAADDYYY